MPSSTTGTAMVGIRVARQFCRNRYITTKTSTMASIRVLTTSLDREADEGGGVDRIDELQAGRQALARARRLRLDRRRGRRARWRPAASLIAMPAAGRPLTAPVIEVVLRPSSTRATSRSRTSEPSGCVLQQDVRRTGPGVCRQRLGGDRGVELLPRRRTAGRRSRRPGPGRSGQDRVASRRTAVSP